ncbi:hypothetical protein pipiens_013676 [Culex pipiens pipiens]|uniref:Uncharacterized protein n=1 Tax=Culex pipiens pipiens TaxID=38569 RepID=A0ABD1CXH9_CULPP
MNSKTVLLLLGAASLFALIHVTAGEDALGTTKEVVSNGKLGRTPAGDKPFGKPGGGGRSVDFHKEVEQIFDEFKVEPGTRDKILERIKERMEKLRAKGGFRRRSGGKGKGKGDQDKKHLD